MLPKNWVESWLKKLRGDILDKYQCTICGWIYDPEKGDPDNNVTPGTAFEDIPDSWKCPICGAPKSEFEKL
jgi:rubredoxin